MEHSLAEKDTTIAASAKTSEDLRVKLAESQICHKETSTKLEKITTECEAISVK